MEVRGRGRLLADESQRKTGRSILTGTGDTDGFFRGLEPGWRTRFSSSCETDYRPSDSPAVFDGGCGIVGGSRGGRTNQNEEQASGERGGPSETDDEWLRWCVTPRRHRRPSLAWCKFDSEHHRWNRH